MRPCSLKDSTITILLSNQFLSGLDICLPNGPGSVGLPANVVKLTQMEGITQNFGDLSGQGVARRLFGFLNHLQSPGHKFRTSGLRPSGLDAGRSFSFLGAPLSFTTAGLAQLSVEKGFLEVGANARGKALASPSTASRA